jgi:hypothetical protein
MYLRGYTSLRSPLFVSLTAAEVGFVLCIICGPVLMLVVGVSQDKLAIDC